jgi:hypothetical protein
LIRRTRRWLVPVTGSPLSDTSRSIESVFYSNNADERSQTIFGFTGK